MHVIDLIRHGESTWVQTADRSSIPLFGGRMNDIPLSKTGWEQATSLGRFARIQSIRPKRVFCSPAVRTRQTHKASAIVMQLGQEPIIVPLLQERDWGRWTGGPRSIQEKPLTRCARKLLGDRFAPPRGESIRTVKRRMTQAVMSIAVDYPEGHYWIHSHRNAIRALVEPLLTAEDIAKGPLTVVSITRVVIYDGRLSLVFYNQPTI